MPETTLFFNMRMTPKVRYLLDIAVKIQNVKLTEFVENAIVAAFDKVIVTDEREANHGEDGPYGQIHGLSLTELANTLYQGNEAGRFLALAYTAPWLLNDGAQKLLSILQHSDYFAPNRVLNAGRIQQNWTILAAIRDGEADVDILSPEQRPDASLAFGLMRDAERVALYKSDPAKFKRESAAYAKAMKGN